MHIATVITICLAVCINAVAAEITVLTTDSRGEPISDAVVTFSAPGSVHAAPPGGAQMRQRNKDFAPKVLAVAAGTFVHFPNDDPVLHHVYSFSPAKSFELDLYSKDTEPTVEFDVAGVVVVGCNIHDEMRGYIYVTADSHFGTSDENGELRFDRLQAGNYQLRIWHPRIHAGTEAYLNVSLAADANERVRVALDLDVDHSDHVDAYERGGYE